MQELSPTELKAYLDQADETPLLLDVREPWEFAHCHIEGSILRPMGQIPACIGELDPQQEIVVICHHGIRSRQVAYYLQHAGFERVINLAGGVESWARLVDATMKRY